MSTKCLVLVYIVTICLVLFHASLARHRRRAMGVDKFLGEWLEEKKEGFEPLADVIGPSGEKRAFIKNSRSQLTYTRDGDTWSLTSGIFGFTRGITHSFRLGEPFISENIDGTPLESVINTDGNRFIERHESLGQKRYTIDIVREVKHDTMVSTITIKHTVMLIVYKRKSGVAPYF